MTTKYHPSHKTKVVPALGEVEGLMEDTGLSREDAEKATMIYQDQCERCGAIDDDGGLYKECPSNG